MKNKMAKAGSLLLVISMGAGLLAGCGSSSGGGTDGAKELNICIWDGMFSEDAINDFEKKNGCKVNVTYIDNTDTMLSKLVEGGNQYDVLDIEAAYVKSFVDNGLLQEIDHSAITNEQ